MKTLKNILLWLVTAIIWYILAIIATIGATAWLWLPLFIGYTIEQKFTVLAFGIIISISTASIARAVIKSL